MSGEPSTRLRLAVGSDVHLLRSITNAAFGRYVALIGTEPAPMGSDHRALVDQGRVWVAVDDDDRPIGLIVLVPHGQDLLIENVAVAPEGQGRGVGRLLLGLAETEGRRLGLRALAVYTNEAMTENLSMYPHLGFVETHRAVDEGYRRVFFRKPLT